MHVLIVEDEPTSLELASVIMAHLGYAVTLCTTGRQAVEMVVERAERFDLIVMDVVLPEMDGLEATKRIRAAAHAREIPILCVSAQAGARSVAAGLEAGCDCYLTKPYRHEELVVAVEQALARRLPRQGGTKVLVVEDDRGCVELLRARLEALGGEAIVASSPEEAIALARAEAPALALVDLNLGRSVDDGFEVIRRLQADPATQGIPVVLHTVHSAVSTPVPVAGMLPKPFRLAQLAELLSTVRRRAS
jgi:CheY-like chemotaxis protein